MKQKTRTRAGLSNILLLTILSLVINPALGQVIRTPGKAVPLLCGQMIDFENRLQTDQSFKSALERLEVQTREYLNRLKETNFADFRSTVVTIPVVVHVVYKNVTENISDAKIQSQIDALNIFFRRMNPDVSTIPAPFNSLAADVMIEFELAKRNPNCLPTTGITRTPTTITSFTNSPTATTAQARNAVKFNSSGGENGWPSDKYLNLWSCDLSGGLIGYASFPSDMAMRPTEDGVVMDFMSFGTIPPVNSGLDLGRVCGHEVGHWLNLRHIWADEALCAGTDFVDDTPDQGPNNTNCPAFPHTDVCSPSSPGVMFMNQMDYTLDACRRLFTLGQSDRMAATLFTVRNSLLSSQGAIPPPSSSMADLWMKDTDEDLGNETNNQSSTFYISDDIWVRNNNDGLINQESQSAKGGVTNYVYVRVRNRGCQPSVGASLKLYWAKASTGLGWPTPWTGTIFLTGTIKMGDPFTPQPIGSIPGNGFQIFIFTWNNTPDPSDYASLGIDLGHFCLLVRIEESSGMTFSEVVDDLWGNVKNNNNIVWKNIGIDDIDGSGFSSTLVSNYTSQNAILKITIDGLKYNKFADPNSKGPGILYVNLDKKLQALIESNKAKISGLEKSKTPGLYLLPKNTATISGVNVGPGEHFVLQLKLVPNKEYRFKRYVYLAEVNQYDERSGKLIGGQLFKLKHNER